MSRYPREGAELLPYSICGITSCAIHRLELQVSLPRHPEADPSQIFPAITKVSIQIWWISYHPHVK